MLFCIDIGNTNIVMGVVDQDRILEHWRVRTEREMTSDEMGVFIGNLFGASGIRMEDIGHIIISCVINHII